VTEPAAIIRAPRIVSIRLAGRGPAVLPAQSSFAPATEDVTTEDERHVLTPTIMFPTDGSARADQRLGPVAYAFLRSLAFEGVPLLASVIDGFDNRLRELLAVPEHARPEAHGLQTYQAAIGAQWQTMAHFCISAERFVSVVSALEAYRDGTLEDPTRALLEPGLNLLAVVYRKDLRRARHWRRLGGLPAANDLILAGIEQRQAVALDAAADQWARQMAARWSQLRTFYTPDLHRVFLAYKHGFSFVSPRSSRLQLQGLGEKQLTDVEAMLARGFAVALARRDGTRWLLVIDASPDELENVFEACRVVLNGLRSVALSWVLELEHSGARSAAIDVDISDSEFLPQAIEAWFGSDLDPVYASVFAEALDIVRTRNQPSQRSNKEPGQTT
jgi:hypothetical protein